jgi:DNA-binding NtrC family response regulator
VSATHRDLEQDVSSRRFRSDLYYRIHVVPIALPPLRERREDVRLIAEDYLARAASEAGRAAMRVDPAALAALQRYAWPGNVRELENALERAVALCEDDVVKLADLPPEVVRIDRLGAVRDELRTGALGLEDAVARFEADLVVEALERAGWNQTRAAETLAITRRLLKLKMDRLGLVAPGEGPAASDETDVPSGTS